MAHELHSLEHYRDWYDEWVATHHRVSMPYMAEQIVDFYAECERIILPEWLTVQNDPTQSTIQPPISRSRSF